MNNFLERIVRVKRQEVDKRKVTHTLTELQESPLFERMTFSMVKKLVHNGQQGIIAEIKRKSPSRQWINANISVDELASGYEKAGVSALSVLTDESFFGGSPNDLLQAREKVQCPILRKEFIIDEYQIIESKSIGADVILLIAAILSPSQLRQFTYLAHKVGLEVLVEVHEESEVIPAMDAEPDMVGVNNRDLDTFEVTLETSRRLAPMLPPTVTRIAESGIHAPEEVLALREYGYQGFLIGEQFMKHDKPALAVKTFLERLALETKQKI